LQFKILSLDGGGVRGVFAAAFLAEIERKVRRPIGEYFDLIAGTSTGAIVAAQLARGNTASSAEELYLRLARDVFHRSKACLSARVVNFALRLASLRLSWLRGLDGAWLLRPKYSADSLRQALHEAFGAATLGELRRRLLIPAVDLIRGQTIVFKTPHSPRFFRDRDVRVVDALLATAAAPTYFPPAIIRTGSAYCDGGLWANHPGMVAYAEVLSLNRELALLSGQSTCETSEISMLSIGTGARPYSTLLEPNTAGIAQWIPFLFDVTSSSQSQGTHFQLQYLLRDRYQRVDFVVPDESWRLDEWRVAPQLAHLGREEAIRRMDELVPRFFRVPAPNFAPTPTTPEFRTGGPEIPLKQT